MTERAVERIPPGDQKKTRCKWVNKHPYQICWEPAVVDVVVRTAASAKRKSWVLHYTVCEEHIPQSLRSVPEDPPEEGMVSSEEAAEIIGIPVMTLYAWRRPERKPRGPSAVKAGRRYWYRRAEVETFAEAYRLVMGLPELT